VWNPVTGCTKVSAGCKHCYAEKIAHRFWPKSRKFTDVQCHPDRLDQPIRWRKPQRVFVNSMSDLFHEKVPDEFIAEVFGVMAVAGAGDDDSGNRPFGGTWRDNILAHRYGPHTFQVLTKRDKRMQNLLSSRSFREKVAGAAYRWAHNKRDAGYLSDCISHTAPGRAGRYWPLSNVHLGVSCENQAVADERIPLLLRTPAARRFVSLEPLLGPIDLLYPDSLWPHGPPYCCNGIGCGCRGRPFAPPFIWAPDDQGIAQVIVGGESGPGARPCHVDWIRHIVQQCREAEVPVFVKQDFGPRPGMQGRIPDDLWIKELPDGRL